MRHLAPILIVFLLLTAARGQIATSTALIGTVTDQNGRTVPAARISVVNRDSGDTYSGVTNDLGYYNIPFLHVGTYEVVVERRAFQRVEMTGLVVNQLAFWVLTDVFGLYYLWGFLLATQFSTAWNFVLLERFVFDGRREGRWARLGWYALMNNVWNVASVPVMYAITTGFGVPHLWANWFVISGMTVVRFAISNRLIWREPGTGNRPGGHGAHAAAEHLVLRHPRRRADRVGRRRCQSSSGSRCRVAGRARHRGVGQQPRVRRLRRRVSVTEADGNITTSSTRPVRVRREDRRRDPLADQVSKLLRDHRTWRTPTWWSRDPGGSWCAGLPSSPTACLQIDGHGVLDHGAHRHGKTTTF
jgi:putative flippase GtrA